MDLGAYWLVDIVASLKLRRQSTAYAHVETLPGRLLTAILAVLVGDLVAGIWAGSIVAAGVYIGLLGGPPVGCRGPASRRVASPLPSASRRSGSS